jgi:hypothetical protein
LSIDGIEVKQLMVPADERAEPRWTQLHFSRGAHQIDLQVPEDGSEIDIQWLRLNQQLGDKRQRQRRQAATDRLLAAGNKSVDGAGGSSSPIAAGSDSALAEATIRRFARRAWRRGVTDQEVKGLMRLYDRGADRGQSLLHAIKLPLKAVLVSPNFLFVTERVHDAAGIHRISDLELASRLSLFLWHSIPDQELLACAEDDRLHLPDVLRQQVKRMLSDDRSYRFSEAFAGQWLGTAAVGRTVIPNTEHFRPVYTTELVVDLRRQVSETMHVMVRENLPVTDWLDCDYVVVNRRLARHYGVRPTPSSNSRFRKVPLVDSPRAGVLGMGAVHMLTSYSQRTSPVLRGGWVLETIFGTRLPAPPPEAGDLDGGQRELTDKSVRQRLEIHRQDPACAACHDLIDPIGFALENFDVLGRWRETEGENPIDAVGKLPSGETFTGPVELRRVLTARKDEFVRELCRRMLGYALGRSLEDADGCTVSHLTTRLADHDYRMQELVMGIVESIPFQFRQGVETSSAGPAAVP